MLRPDTRSEYVDRLSRQFRKGSDVYFLDRLLTAGIAGLVHAHPPGFPAIPAVAPQDKLDPKNPPPDRDTGVANASTRYPNEHKIPQIINVSAGAKVNELAAEFPETVVVVGSFSKTYAMTGWRLGFLLGPRDP